MIALLLNKYPDLSWRDVREIIAKSARKNDPTDTDWKVNRAGYNINHKYGFGTIHAQNALTTASSWTKISSDYISYSTPLTQIIYPIPDNNSTGATQTITVSGSGINKIEYIEIYFYTNHSYLGDLTITLKNGTTNTQSILYEKHTCRDSSGNKANCENYSTGEKSIRLGSARHLGESSNATWTITAKDTSASDTGSFRAYLVFRGRAN